MLGSAVPDANAIADWFLWRSSQDDGTLVSHLKLQKLCYYAQGYALASLGRPLFSDPVEAWQHGPVVRSVYLRFRGCGSSPLAPAPNFDHRRFDNAESSILGRVYDDKGHYSAWALREQSHAEAPWRNVYGGSTDRISETSMMSWFEQVVV